MIAETGLRLAGPGAVLASRPAGVAHVVPAGPLTRSGRFVPRARRPLCRAHTRRLAVVTYADCADIHRLCARCSACLSKGEVGRQVGQRTRDEYRTRNAHVTAWDLVCEIRAAQSTDELDDVAHLTLVLFDHTGCIRPVTRPDGRISASLHTHIGWHRQRVLGFPNRAADAAGLQVSIAGRERRRQEYRQARKEREAAITRLGFVNGSR